MVGLDRLPGTALAENPSATIRAMRALLLEVTEELLAERRRRGADR